jgi:integrase
MAKVLLTDRFIASPRRVPERGRVDYQDTQVPGLALRVTSTGHRSFNLITRYPANPKNPTRRNLGEYGAINLDEAREKAREWIGLIRKGTDPRTHEARRKATEQRNQVNTFGVVAAAFIERHVVNLSKATDAKRSIETEFVARWGQRPITDVTPGEVAEAVRAIVKRGSPYQAHNALGYLRRMYNWAIGTHEFGITQSPVERLKPADLIGRREARERVLLDGELRAVWGACEGMGHPYGPLVKMMILTGQREREIADMVWSEVNFDQALWTIPAKRMKGGRSHAVPLAPETLALLRGLPRFKGEYVFTTTDGEKPVNGFAKAKVRIDKLCGVTGWKFHDLRRTARTGFSALPVQDLVRELVIAHARPGLHKVYDQHSYIDEKRECLTLWEARLRGILAPKPPAEVADIEAERGRRAVV